MKLVASRSFFAVFYAVLKINQAVLSFVMFWFFEAFFETAISTCDLKEKEMISEKLEACLFNTFFFGN